MSKIYPRVMRRDSMEQHSHSMPDGKETSGQLLKPSASSEAGLHTHLYDHDGQTYETGQEFDLPGHEHDTILGETSGPKKSQGASITPKQVQAAPLGEKV